MIVPRADFDSEIMQSHTCEKNILHAVVSFEPALVFDSAHDFRTSHGIYAHPDGGNLSVVFL